MISSFQPNSWTGVSLEATGLVELKKKKKNKSIRMAVRAEGTIRSYQIGS